MATPITLEGLEIQQKLQFLYIIFIVLCIATIPLSMFKLAEGFSELVPFLQDLICCACGLLLTILTFRHPLVNIPPVSKLVASICFLCASGFSVFVGFLTFGNSTTKAIPYLCFFFMVLPSIVGGIILFNFIPVFLESFQLAKNIKQKDGKDNQNQDPSGGTQNSNQQYENEKYENNQNTQQTVTIQDQNQTEVSLNDNNLQENLNPDHEPSM